MVAAAHHVSPLAERLGVLKLTGAVEEIASLGVLHLANAPYQNGQPACAWDSSEIALPVADAKEEIRESVLIDIGGTQTKVGYQNGLGEIRSVFDHANTWFENKASFEGPPLEQFISVLISEIRRALPQLTPTCCIGLIWSNQVQCVPIHRRDTLGVSGIVRGTKTGGYRKGEWFLREVRDGDDVGALFLRTLSRFGWTPSVFLLGNDTIFTLFAISHATAGVVMSSGGNCTVIGDEGREKGHIINTELGGHLKLPEHLLSDGDRACATFRGVSSLALEELCAGTWFPHIVYAHVCAAVELPEGAPLTNLRDALVSGEVSLTNRMLVAALKQHSPTSLPAEVASAGSTFVQLLEALVNRAGLLAGILSYLSISSQLNTTEKKALVSLDSSMARHFPGFYTALKSTFQELCGTRAGDIALIRPQEFPQGGDISVPMQGIARALNTFRASPAD
jgi:hypothetical protein